MQDLGWRVRVEKVGLLLRGKGMEGLIIEEEDFI